MDVLLGSICLSDIPKECMKKVQTKNGEKYFLNIAVIERKEPSAYGHTHFISCSPKKEERKEGVNYIFGDLKRWQEQPSAPTYEEIESAPPVNPDEDTDLPF